MKSNYKSIGYLVERIDERNRDGSITTLVGVSIDKKFIPSVANVIGTDLTNYKVIRKYDFAVSLMQVSRDEKIPVACQKDYDAAIMSPAYPIFRVKDENVILPEYLEMWFMRSEFDREASFIAVGGVRGSMPWEDFAKLKLPVPSIEEQREIVSSYRTITERIALKKRINDNLVELCKTEFMKTFASCPEYQDEQSSWFSQPLGKALSRVAMGPFGSNIKTDCFVEEGIPVLNGDNISGYLLSEKAFRYVNEEKAYELKNSIAHSGDIVITHRGTLGQVALIPDKTKFKEYVISQSQFMLTCTQSKILPEYVLFYFHTDAGRRRLLANDNTTGVPSIAKPTSYIKSLHIPIPPIELQQRWAVLVGKSLATLASNNLEIERLTEFAQTILSTLCR